MEIELRKEILQRWKLSELPLDKLVVILFEKVRDIPFGDIGSWDPKEVYTRNKGSCAGKNVLLRELYHEIGIEAKDIVCLQRWRDLIWFPDDTYGVVDLPGELRQMLQRDDTVAFHNYIKISRDGKWVTVDATIDLPLRKVGFTTTDGWDGRSDMPLCFAGSRKEWDCGAHGLEKKAALANELPSEIAKASREFFVALSRWIDTLRK